MLLEVQEVVFMRIWATPTTSTHYSGFKLFAMSASSPLVQLWVTFLTPRASQIEPCGPNDPQWLSMSAKNAPQEHHKRALQGASRSQLGSPGAVLVTLGGPTPSNITNSTKNMPRFISRFVRQP